MEVNKSSTRRQKIQVVIMFSIISIIIYLSFKLRNDETDKILKNHFDTIGIITNVGWKSIDISYQINGKFFTYTQNKPYKNLCLGESFYLMAYEFDLNKAKVFFTQPIIDTIKCKYNVTDLIEVNTIIIDNSELIFNYKVGEEKFERIQKFEEGKRPNQLNNLKVKYRVDMPEIGYLVEQ